MTVLSFIVNTVQFKNNNVHPEVENQSPGSVSLYKYMYLLRVTPDRPDVTRNKKRTDYKIVLLF